MIESLVRPWRSAMEPRFSHRFEVPSTHAYRRIPDLVRDNRAGTMKTGVAIKSANWTAKRLHLTGPTDLHNNGRLQYGIRVPPLFPVQ